MLAQFAVSAGVPLSFDPALLGNRQSPGLNGNYGVLEGFQQLLHGSGFDLISSGTSGYTSPPCRIQWSPELGATTISGESAADAEVYSGGQVARSARLGLLGNQSVEDVPFSVTSYTAQTIRDQQAQTVGDVLLNDASVRQSSGFGNFSQVFVIRGLPLNGDDIAYNGLYGVLPRQIIATEALERVELFKGPNAFINGVTPAAAASAAGSTCNPSAPGTYRPAVSPSMPVAPAAPARTSTWANASVKTTASAPASTCCNARATAGSTTRTAARPSPPSAWTIAANACGCRRISATRSR